MTSPPCTRVTDLLSRASSILADDAVGADRTWPRGELLSHLNEAMSELRKLRPDIFTRVETLTLSPGALQRLPDGLGAFVGLLGNVTVDETGFVAQGAPIAESDMHFGAALRRKPCLASPASSLEGASGDDRTYTIVSYVRDPQLETIFTVHPPVPIGLAPRVQAKVVARAPHYTSADLDACLGVEGEHQASLLDWILMRAYAKETESQYAGAQVERYRKAWYDAVNAGYLQDSRWNSGLWAGQDQKRPSADPNFRQH